MRTPNACSALVNGVCTNGFPVTPACDPVQAPWRCHACHRESERQPTPLCLSELWCARVYADFGGKPSEGMVEIARSRAALPRQAEMFAKPTKPRSYRAHVVDAGNGPGPGYWAEFECSRCGWRSEWMRIANVSEGKRGVPCPNCNQRALGEMTSIPTPDAETGE